MGLKTRDLRRTEDAFETSITQLLKDFAKFKKEERYLNYNDDQLLMIYKNIVWMSEIDRKIINKLEETKKRQRDQFLKNKSKEFEYPKWSEDPHSTKIKEFPTLSRMSIIIAAVLCLIIVVLLILTFTKWIG